MPDWLFGFWQSRERYKPQDEIVDYDPEAKGKVVNYTGKQLKIKL